jgi:hypothetical protein
VAVSTFAWRVTRIDHDEPDRLIGELRLAQWMAVLFVIQRDPREGLLIASLGLVAHALVDIAHRPGWLPPDLSPRWFTAGCATYNVYLAAWCFWARHR